MKKYVSMLNLGTTTLERILEMGKRSKDHGGLGFKGENRGNNVLTEETQKGKDHYHRINASFPALRCYYCRKQGHIRKECSHFLMYQETRQQVQDPKTKQVWIIKRDGRCLVVYTSLKTKVEEKWYFECGSSKHMISNREFLINLQPCSLDSITFGDGGKGTILGSCSLKVLGMPKLENVLLVDGLKVNLINISQLCDDNLLVQFTKEVV